MKNEIVATLVVAIFSSGGLWALITALIMKVMEKKSARTKLLLGLAHDTICSRGAVYLQRGSITRDEYENLHDYLYLPYEALGGNGTAKKVVDDCGKLPMKNNELGKVYFKEMI